LSRLVGQVPASPPCGRWRRGPSGAGIPRGLSMDQDGTFGVRDAVLAHGAQEQADELSVASLGDHEQRSALGR